MVLRHAVLPSTGSHFFPIAESRPRTDDPAMVPNRNRKSAIIRGPWEGANDQGKDVDHGNAECERPFYQSVLTVVNPVFLSNKQVKGVKCVMVFDLTEHQRSTVLRSSMAEKRTICPMRPIFARHCTKYTSQCQIPKPRV